VIVQDYYAILGLDLTASAESIKTAYRRLARKNHPDHNILSTDDERNSRALVMAELNEAYSVLSDPNQRREYNEKLRLMGMMASERTTVSATVEATASFQKVTASKTTPAVRVRPNQEADETFVAQVSSYLWGKLLATNADFSWKQVVFEGFDRGAEALSWSSCHCLALRAFPILDSATAKKFLNYSGFAIEHHKRQIRTTNFAFLLVFQHAQEWESVVNQCQAFVAGKPVAPTNVLLLDMKRGQVRRFGAAFSSKRFEHLVQTIRIST
jgi:curved DNA-binding protein CbpA